MEELLKALSDTVSQAQKLSLALQNAATYAHNVIEEGNQKLKSANDKETLNVLESADLAAREAKVRKIENIIKLEEDGRILAKQNEAMMDRLEAFKEAFEKEKSIALKDIGAKMRKIADDNAMLEKEWAIYKTREAELKAREADYKERIAKSIISGVEKR